MTRPRGETRERMHLQLKLGVASALDKLGILDGLRRSGQKKGLILTFHRVLREADIASCYEPHIAIRASVFEDLLMLLKREYQVVPLTYLMEQAGKGRERQLVSLTFDDGWEDTYSVVCPLLKHLDVSATVFLCSGLLDGKHLLPEERFARIWATASQRGQLARLVDDLQTWRVGYSLPHRIHAWGRCLKQLPIEVKLMMLSHLEQVFSVVPVGRRHFITWEQARLMQANGLTFGSHTARHATLNAEEPAAMLKELRSSRETIICELDAPCTMLAYPNGAFDARVRIAAREAGYQHAFTTDNGFVDPSTDPLAVPRLSIAGLLVEGRNTGLHAARTRLHLRQLTPSS